MESLGPRRVWVGKDLPAQLVPWAGTLSPGPGCSKRSHVTIPCWKTSLCSSKHKTIPLFLSVPSQAAQSRELCHCWHQHCHPTCDLTSLLLTKGWGQAGSQPLLGDISSREWLIRDTPVPSPGSCRMFQYSNRWS